MCTCIVATVYAYAYIFVYRVVNKMRTHRAIYACTINARTWLWAYGNSDQNKTAFTAAPMLHTAFPMPLQSSTEPSRATVRCACAWAGAWCTGSAWALARFDRGRFSFWQSLATRHLRERFQRRRVRNRSSLPCNFNAGVNRQACTTAGLCLGFFSYLLWPITFNMTTCPFNKKLATMDHVLKGSPHHI